MNLFPLSCTQHKSFRPLTAQSMPCYTQTSKPMEPLKIKMSQGVANNYQDPQSRISHESFQAHFCDGITIFFHQFLTGSYILYNSSNALKKALAQHYCSDYCEGPYWDSRSLAPRFKNIIYIFYSLPISFLPFLFLFILFII